MIKQINIKVTREQHQEAKVLAARLGTSVKGLFLLGVDEGRKRLAKEEFPGKVKPRVDWIKEF